MNASFSVTTESIDGLEAVSVAGELDEATAPRLREALEAVIGQVDHPVVVDLSGCEFIDSTGLSLLVETQRRLAESDRSFAVCSVRPEVGRLLELTGIDTAIGLYQTREDALSSLRPSSSV